eukprot:4306989-Ditylum_brightwellii.AAC.1
MESKKNTLYCGAVNSNKTITKFSDAPLREKDTDSPLGREGIAWTISFFFWGWIGGADRQLESCQILFIGSNDPCCHAVDVEGIQHVFSMDSIGKPCYMINCCLG